VSRKAGALRQGLEGLVAQYPDMFEGVTGAGLMLGLKCKVSNMDVVTAGYDCEVLTVPAADNVVRVLPALNISNAEIAQALERLEIVAQTVQSAQ
jgi:acetylornithine/N-succinyldiaminopimelate aminotransferase